MVTIVLTVAHLGNPAQRPFFFHVTRHAMADEIVELVGFFMPANAEGPEWLSMMYDRATSELLRSSPTNGACFFVALPCGASSPSPSGTVIINTQPTAPIWIRLTDWSLLPEPFNTAHIVTKPAPCTKMKATDLISDSAAFTDAGSKTALALTYRFRMTGVRTSASIVRRLLRREVEHLVTDDAISIFFTSSLGSTDTGALRAAPLNPLSLCETDGRTSQPDAMRRIVRKHTAANGTSRFGGADSWTTHGVLYHIDEYPENCADENLAALCQKCHNNYDAPTRAAGLKARRRATMAAGDLFPGVK
jgi:hypothetical protein